MAAAAVLDRSESRSKRRDTTINVRATVQVRELIDQAAAVIGKTRSEFMLESARTLAEDVLLDQKLFVLNDQRYTEFLRLLDEPAKPSAKLRELLAHKAPWDK